mmetsp:Transcript_7297/g.16989  ORF Transcript_7297/g.16989 Transcript_7297/m.16989 type:complete len:340 (+) Transcript_7297:1024-2043(+)
MRSRMTRHSPARSVSVMESSEDTAEPCLDATTLRASAISYSSMTPSPFRSIIIDSTSRPSASSSSVTSPSPSASNASSEICPSSDTSLSTAPTTMPDMAKKSIPTWKKNVWRNSNVSSSSSPSSRNRSDICSTIDPSGPPTTMVDRNRPIKPRPPTSASMESMTGLICLGVLWIIFSTDSSHATSRATIQVIASTLHSSANSSSSKSECTEVDFVLASVRASIASAFAMLPSRLDVDEAAETAELASVGRASNSDSDSRTGRALRSVPACPLLLAAAASRLRNWAVESFEDRGKLVTVGGGESHAGRPELTKATAGCSRDADESRAMQPAAICILRLIS